MSSCFIYIYIYIYIYINRENGDIHICIHIYENIKYAIKIKYNCNLIIDEAHAFGVFGQKGLGVAEEFGIINDVDLLVGTFGKAIGSMGAFAVGSRTLIDFLINKSRSFIFSTALPPINIAFTKWIIENKLPQTLQKRKKMLEIAKNFGSQRSEEHTSELQSQR